MKNIVFFCYIFFVLLSFLDIYKYVQDIMT